MISAVVTCKLEMVVSFEFPYSQTTIEMGIFGNTFLPYFLTILLPLMFDGKLLLVLNISIF